MLVHFRRVKTRCNQETLAMSSSLIERFQTKYNVSLRSQWLQETISRTVSDENVIYNEFLQSRLQDSAMPKLPSDIQTMHNVPLSGSYVFQIDEIIDVGISAQAMYDALTMRMEGVSRRGRIMSDEPDTNALPRGMLRLALTDGTTTVLGMEYKPLSISIDMQLGTKVKIKDAIIKRGVLMLTPGCFTLLGGEVASYNQGRIWYGLVKQHAKILKIPDDQVPKPPAVSGTGVQNAPPMSDEFDELPDEAFNDLPLDEYEEEFDEIPIEDIPNDIFDQIQPELRTAHDGQTLSDVDFQDDQVLSDHVGNASNVISIDDED